MAIVMNPAFLLIGSMKSGTTSLFEDFTRHSEIFCPSIKEPGDLCSDEVLTKKGREKYLKIFSGATPEQWVGEATTHYTYLPAVSGVPERAFSIFGSELKLIFIGRDPVERLCSHYRHEVQRGTIQCSLNDAIDDNPLLKDVSKYDSQLKDWLRLYPREQLLVLDMQDYVDNPEKVVRSIWKFLGLEHERMIHGVTANVSAGKRAPRGLLRKIVRSRAYGLYGKRFLSASLRKWLRSVLVPKRASSFDDYLPPEVLGLLQEEFASELEGFASMVDEDRFKYGSI